jgi:predicted nucleotidyltransferase component of viral defense system
MISAEALRRIARRQGISVGWAEKDYVISWFLKELYESNCLKESLVFKGGTALKKVYFPETWRLSHDLDFTAVAGLDSGTVRRCLEEVFTAIAQKSGLSLRLSSFRAIRGGLDAKIQFAGPLVHKNQISLDITFDEKLVTEPEWTAATTEYPDVPVMKVKVYSLNEILVEKIRSIMQRGRSRDYYDVWRLLMENEFDMTTIEALLVEKCLAKGVEYDPGIIFDDERLREAGRYWQSALGELVRELPKFETVVSELRKRLGSLIGP